MSPTDPIRTPDARYIVVRGRLWRASNPSLSADYRQRLVDDLMDARREVQSHYAGAARRRVDEIKRALGERGPVWWDDGSPDFNRKMIRNTPYGGWYQTLR